MSFIEVWAKCSIQIIEGVVVLAVVGLIVRLRSRPAPFFLRLEKHFRELARRKTPSIASIGFLAIVIRVALIPVIGIPVPATHDEFSYLLAADTFAHWHWTNPPHPMWIHFESYHLIQNPSYMSMYAPGQGIILALGQLLGHPWIGILLINALMCSALCWMLQAWLPPEWALLGGLLAVLRLGILSYWVNTYWGGALAALGGVLLLGSLPRIRRYRRTRDAMLMALGIIILANSRPYEGFIFSLPVAVALLAWLIGPKRPKLGIALRQIITPMLLMLMLGAATTGYYYYRVTGSPFEMPQVLNRRIYSRSRYLIWQAPQPEPVYHHVIMQRFYDIEFSYFQQGRTISGFILHAAEKIELLWLFFLGPLFTIPLLALPWVLRDRRMRFPLIAGGVFMLGLALEIWTAPHYFAPATGILYLILLQCMRHLRFWQPHGRPLGAALVRSVPLVCCAMIILRVTAVLAHTQIENPWPRGNLARAQVERTLEHEKGMQLVLVRYSSSHSPLDEWVYNLSNIDLQKVVWARDMGEAENRELLAYYPDRQVWLIGPDQSPLRLVPLSTSVPADRSAN
jgi:hypothetical protein